MSWKDNAFYTDWLFVSKEGKAEAENEAKAGKKK